MLRRQGMSALIALLTLTPIATADQYWVAYEGNDLPENEGWSRTFTDPNNVVGRGGAIRTFEDGALVLDSLESVWIVDFYQMSRPIDPGPGEYFRMEWRARYDRVAPRTDPGVSVFSDESWAVAFEFSDSDMRSVFEPGVTASFAPGVSHEFELLSADMREYEVHIDGVLALTGAFDRVFSASRVGWGDVIQGGVSVSRWDYMRFGVVPEPATAALLAILALAARMRRRMVRRTLLLPITALAIAPWAHADQYWVAYEGDDFPENEGWERLFSDPNNVFGQGGADRTLVDGNLILDSRESVYIVDFYNMERPIDPDPGETFIMQWRLRVDDIPSSVSYDPTVVVFSDESRAVAFEFAEDGLRSLFETRERLPYEFGVFHAFELISSDMLTYELFMDGNPFHVGAFNAVAGGSRVGWGDGVQGATSLSTWGRFEFGVVPEPQSAVLAIFLLTLCANHRRSLRRATPGEYHDTINGSCCVDVRQRGVDVARRRHHFMG